MLVTVQFSKVLLLSPLFYQSQGQRNAFNKQNGYRMDDWVSISGRGDILPLVTLPGQLLHHAPIRLHGVEL